MGWGNMGMDEIMLLSSVVSIGHCWSFRLELTTENALVCVSENNYFNTNHFVLKKLSDSIPSKMKKKQTENLFVNRKK